MAVVIYDGECGLCSNFVKMLAAVNKNPKLFITDFSSEWTRNHLKIENHVDSVLFVTATKRYSYSDAVIHLLAAANPVFKPLYLMKVIPKPLRDALYKMVARHRKKILPAPGCTVPSSKERSMFLS